MEMHRTGQEMGFSPAARAKIAVGNDQAEKFDIMDTLIGMDGDSWFEEAQMEHLNTWINKGNGVPRHHCLPPLQGQIPGFRIQKMSPVPVKSRHESLKYPAALKSNSRVHAPLQTYSLSHLC